MADNGATLLRDRGVEFSIVREPLTYERHAPVSFYRDLVSAERGDNAAKHRLFRHGQEMLVEGPRLDRELRSRASGSDAEYRVNPNRTDGQGGYFSPPAWLVSEFATAPRPGRVLANLIPTFPLPAGVSQVNLPVLTTGEIDQPDVDGAPVPDRDVVDAAVSSPAAPFVGQSDWSLQTLDQSPAGAHLDWAMFKDLTASYDHQLELALFNGPGGTTQTSQLTGLLNLPTGTGKVSAVAYTDASPTGSKMFTQLGYVAALLGDARLMPPEVWLMRTARWAFLGTAEHCRAAVGCSRPRSDASDAAPVG